MSDIENAKTMRELAKLYHGFGFNVVPLGGDKRPVVTGTATNGKPLRFAWKEWETQPQTEMLLKQILRPAWWTQVQGIAAVCGPVSGNLVCIDFDKCAQETVENFLSLLGLPADYEWVVQTPGDGFHIWIHAATELELPAGKLRRPALDGHGHVELRYTGHYSALPGSKHPNGGLYKFLHDTRPTQAPVRRDTSV